MNNIAWVDLTVDDAPLVRDFYARVMGWLSEPLDMGGYSDFVMHDAASGDAVAGVCHARGGNAGLPPVWMVYFRVADLDASLAQVAGGGGEIVQEPRTGGGARFAVVKDPAGAVCALFEAEPVE